MAKRRHGTDAELPFVALMDTMTNVVGVLTIVLVMIGISLASAVHKVLSDLPPVTPAQVAEVKAAVDKMTATQQASKERVKALDKPEFSPAQLKRLEEELRQLEITVKDKGIKLYDLAALREESGKRTDELAKTKETVDKLLAERDRLKALLDETPLPKPPDPTQIRIPDSRDIPQDAAIFYCFIRGDQAHIIDLPRASRMLEDFITRKKSDLTREIVKQKGKPDKIIFDQNKVIASINARNLGSRGQKITMTQNPFGTRPTFRIDINPDKGDASLDDMKVPNGPFHRMMATIASYPKAVLIFKVRPDGFATYLEAREIADRATIPCGWEIDGNSHMVGAVDVAVNRLQEPPPPDPNKPKETKPPAPKRRLD